MTEANKIPEQEAAKAADNKVLEAMIEAQANELNELRAALKDLSSEVSSKSATSSAALPGTDPEPKKIPVCPEFTLGAKKYKFNVPTFSLNGLDILVAEDVVADKKLLEKVVTEYPGLVTAK